MTSHRPRFSPETYVEAYREATELWHFMLSNDEACRDIDDRDEYLMGRMSEFYPFIPTEDLRYLGKIAQDTVIDRLNT